LLLQKQEAQQRRNEETASTLHELRVAHEALTAEVARLADSKQDADTSVSEVHLLGAIAQVRLPDIDCSTMRSINKAKTHQ
jgi:hypothetical protein